MARRHIALITALILLAAPAGARPAACPVAPDPTALQTARGRLVVRPAPAGSTPMLDRLLPIVEWESYDPHNTLDPTADFYGDFINYNARTADLRAAGAAHASGILFVKELPRAQLIGH